MNAPHQTLSVRQLRVPKIGLFSPTQVEQRNVNVSIDQPEQIDEGISDNTIAEIGTVYLSTNRDRTHFHLPEVCQTVSVPSTQ